MKKREPSYTVGANVNWYSNLLGMHKTTYCILSQAFSTVLRVIFDDIPYVSTLELNTLLDECLCISHLIIGQTLG